MQKSQRQTRRPARPVRRPAIDPKYLRPTQVELPELPEAPESRLLADPRRRAAWARLAAAIGTRPDPDEAPTALPEGPVRRLVHRITQGFSQAEYQRARALGYEAYLEEQLHPESIDDSEAEGRLVNFLTLDYSPKQMVDSFPEEQFIPVLDLKGAMVVRSVHSKRQLFERMCEFWTDHFNIDHQKELQFALKSEDDKTVVRQHALGTFPELLRASARSAAMMYYLDNWINVVGLPQENYARELMELHSLGVDGGYTELDVKEVSRTLTGWSLEFEETSPDFLRFKFQPTFHDPGPKFVLGEVIPPGEAGGEILIQRLALHPNTARHISTKLARWFLGENPPQDVIDAATATYQTTGGDIKSILRVLLRRENLTRAEFQPKFRRPFHLATSILRGLEADVVDPRFLLAYLSLMGQSPYDWGPPNGYPDTVAAWGSSLLPRWQFLAFLMAGVIPGAHVRIGQVNSLLGGFDREGLPARLSQNVLGGLLSPREQRLLDELLAAGEPLVWPEVFEAIGLAASGPGFQWY